MHYRAVPPREGLTAVNDDPIHAGDVARLTLSFWGQGGVTQAERSPVAPESREGRAETLDASTLQALDVIETISQVVRA
jgi:hypothetical protein